MKSYASIAPITVFTPLPGVIDVIALRSLEPDAGKSSRSIANVMPVPGYCNGNVPKSTVHGATFVPSNLKLRESSLLNALAYSNGFIVNINLASVIPDGILPNVCK